MSSRILLSKDMEPERILHMAKRKTCFMYTVQDVHAHFVYQ